MYEEEIIRSSQLMLGSAGSGCHAVNCQSAGQAEFHKHHLIGHLVQSGSWLDQATADKRELKAEKKRTKLSPRK